ncbi:DUF3761 domain-containing protein [Chromobacterium haemolyticum]|uniref:DUF3761 domain-containing protein n=1 Tax=Chromobacterium haemolyticum TaxID=394935 RepID=UPI00307D3DFA
MPIQPRIAGFLGLSLTLSASPVQAKAPHRYRHASAPAQERRLEHCHVNSDGVEVHCPARPRSAKAPAGASAL